MALVPRRWGPPSSRLDRDGDDGASWPGGEREPREDPPRVADSERFATHNVLSGSL